MTAGQQRWKGSRTQPFSNLKVTTARGNKDLDQANILVASSSSSTRDFVGNLPPQQPQQPRVPPKTAGLAPSSTGDEKRALLMRKRQMSMMTPVSPVGSTLAGQIEQTLINRDVKQDNRFKPQLEIKVNKRLVTTSVVVNMSQPEDPRQDHIQQKSKKEKEAQQAQLEENANLISSRSTRNEPNTALIASQGNTQLMEATEVPQAEP